MANEEKIRRYLNDEMDTREVAAFEKEIQHSPLLAQEIEERLEQESIIKKKLVKAEPKNALEMAHIEFIEGLDLSHIADKSKLRMYSAWFLLLISLLILLGYLTQ